MYGSWWRVLRKRDPLEQERQTTPVYLPREPRDCINGQLNNNNSEHSLCARHGLDALWVCGWVGVCVCVYISHSVVSDSLRAMDCSLPGSSVRGILQARIMEWVTIPFSRGSSQPGDQTWGSCIAGRFFTV